MRQINQNYPRNALKLAVNLSIFSLDRNFFQTWFCKS